MSVSFTAIPYYSLCLLLVCVGWRPRYVRVKRFERDGFVFREARSRNLTGTPVCDGKRQLRPARAALSSAHHSEPWKLIPRQKWVKARAQMVSKDGDAKSIVDCVILLGRHVDSLGQGSRTFLVSAALGDDSCSLRASVRSNGANQSTEVPRSGSHPPKLRCKSVLLPMPSWIL